MPGALLFPMCYPRLLLGAGPSRFGQQAQQQPPVGQHPAQQQQQQQQQPGGPHAAPAQRPRPSGLVDDGSLWARSGDRGQQQQSQLNPLGGDAGPMHMEQDEVSWEEEEEALPLSLPPPGAPASTLPPGAIM